MLVELKNGETYNGHLASCDAWMNVYLTQVICTSRDGDHFWKMAECYIRGSTIKYLRIPDEVLENYKEDSSNRGQMMKRDGGGQNRGGNRPGQQRSGGNRPNNNQNQNNRGGFNQNNNSNNRRNGGTMSASSGSISGSAGNLAPKPAKQQRK